MIYIKQFVLFLMLVVALPVFSQDFRLGKVSKEELLEKRHPIDTSATAAVLYKKGKTYFKVSGTGYWEMLTEVEVRIKIYKKEGYTFADEELTYYSGGQAPKVYFTDAYTYDLVNGAIEKTKLKAEGQFEQKISANYTTETIKMPNVKVGSVIEYKYFVQTSYFHVFPDWHFQYTIPVNTISYEVGIPDGYNYNKYLTGYEEIQQSDIKTRFGMGGEFQENVVTYSAKNVKALKDEAYVDNIQNYMTTLKMELSSVKLNNGVVKAFSSDWAAVAKEIYSENSFGKELKLTSYFEKDLPALFTPGMTQKAKIAAVFYYVQQRMKWNKRKSYQCNKGVETAYKEKTGNAAEINLMLIAMLRKEGINANPVLVSTRSNGIALFPGLTAHDYVVAAVYFDNEFMLLDATSKYNVPGQLPVRALNWVGRQINENGNNAQIDLMPKTTSKEVLYLTADLAADGKFTGKARDQYFDYNAHVFREDYNMASLESYSEKVEGRYPGIEINNSNIVNGADVLKPVSEEFSFTHASQADVIGDKIYFNPMLFFTTAENPFKQENREYPVDFVFPQQDKYMINIKLPDGYVVESVPESVTIAMEDNIGSFAYNILIKNNQVQLNVLFDINRASIAKEHYGMLKDFYRKIIEKQTEKIVLKKA
jgi:hypothetical protein